MNGSPVATTTRKNNSVRLTAWLPGAAAGLLASAALLWLTHGPPVQLSLRVPGTDQPAGTDPAALTNAVLAGKLIRTGAEPAEVPGLWPGFRGPARDGLSTEGTPLARTWGGAGPRELWSLDVGEGYAGAAVLKGRVYLMDYDREKKQDALRCLSLAEGKELWRYAYPIAVKRNHGMSRTVPAVTDKFVVALGPKCHVVCLDSVTGELKWGLDLVRQYGAAVPPWYAGQCPLIDHGAVVLAPGGQDALLLAVEGDSGRVLWQSPNPRGWKMTHSSIMPMEFAGRRMYIYCANLGVAGVSAEDGQLLWETTEWKISLATVPSPVPLAGGRIFFTGGYNAGSLMVQLHEDNGRLQPRTVFKLEAEVFGATQHTPILYEGYLYGVRADGRLVCLDLQGQVVWASDAGHQFGLGSFLLAGGLIYALNDSGRLTLVEATPTRFNPLAQAQVLQGRESWGPMCLANGRLIARDLTRIACLDVAAR
jgi:outer membrane protein assembly factor BamB